MSKATAKILVVDDEEIIREVFVTAFDEYRIITAANASQALDILNYSNDIDLIVLDVMMPGLKWTDLLREIKRINPNHKVVILTGHSSKEISIEIARSGIDVCIEKPFDIKNIKQVFERLLSKPHKPHPM